MSASSDSDIACAYYYSARVNSHCDCEYGSSNDHADYHSGPTGTNADYYDYCHCDSWAGPGLSQRTSRDWEQSFSETTCGHYIEILKHNRFECSSRNSASSKRRLGYRGLGNSGNRQSRWRHSRNLAADRRYNIRLGSACCACATNDHGG